MKIPVADWFFPFLYPCEYKNLYGGRSSGKSHQMAILAVARLAHLFRDPDNIKIGAPYYPLKKVRILAGREFNTSIEMSVKTVVEDKIQQMGLFDQFIIQSEQITHRETKSRISFKGLGRNINNIRSAEGIDVWWLEESQYLTEALMDVVLPTARYDYTCPITGIKFRNEKWFVWNPENRTDWVWQRFVMGLRPTDLSLHVNYNNNPYLPDASRDEAEICRLNKPAKYEHDWLGRPNDSNIESQVVPYKMIEKCVSAWDKRPNIHPNMRVDCGLDIAYLGNDNCAAAVRVGPMLQDLKVWRGSDNINETAKIATDFFHEVADSVGMEPDQLFYDAATPMTGSFDILDVEYPTTAVGFGTEPSGKKEEWESGITNAQYFAKRNIQMATAIRQRAFRTSEWLAGNGEIDPEDALFINPNIENLERVKGMLTQPLRRQNPTNAKFELFKQGMKKELKSPDEFDALCLAFEKDSEYGLRAEG